MYKIAHKVDGGGSLVHPNTGEVIMGELIEFGVCFLLALYPRKFSNHSKRGSSIVKSGGRKTEEQIQ